MYEVITEKLDKIETITFSVKWFAIETARKYLARGGWSIKINGTAIDSPDALDKWVMQADPVAEYDAHVIKLNEDYRSKSDDIQTRARQMIAEAINKMDLEGINPLSEEAFDAELAARKVAEEWAKAQTRLLSEQFDAELAAVKSALQEKMGRNA